MLLALPHPCFSDCTKFTHEMMLQNDTFWHHALSHNEAARLEGHSSRVAALCVLPDGRLASGSRDSTINRSVSHPRSSNRTCRFPAYGRGLETFFGQPRVGVRNRVPQAFAAVDYAFAQESVDQLEQLRPLVIALWRLKEIVPLLR
jgi:hypothetical protein